MALVSALARLDVLGRYTADKQLDLRVTAAARPNAEGRWEILGDPAHKITSAQLYRLDEAMALYKNITAPVLAVEASDDSLGQWWKGRYTLEEFQQRIGHVPNLRRTVVQDAGHMMHHDQPTELAGLMEDFLA